MQLAQPEEEEEEAEEEAAAAAADNRDSELTQSHHLIMVERSSFTVEHYLGYRKDKPRLRKQPFTSDSHLAIYLSHRARNPGKQLNKKSTYSTFFESVENSAPLLPRTCMFYKIFSDDQEMATNQKIGLCDYLRTEW